VAHGSCPGDRGTPALAEPAPSEAPALEGREVVVAARQPAEEFGDLPRLDGKERTADARAMTACDLAILERRDVFAFLERQPNAWPRLVEVLCDRLRTTDQHIAEVALLQLPVRLAKALLRMADSEANAARGPNSAIVQLSQRELGNIVGAARESVNKCLREWQRSGLVRIEGTSITISNRATLEDVAEQS